MNEKPKFEIPELTVEAKRPESTYGMMAQPRVGMRGVPGVESIKPMAPIDPFAVDEKGKNFFQRAAEGLAKFGEAMANNDAAYLLSMLGAQISPDNTWQQRLGQGMAQYIGAENTNAYIQAALRGEPLKGLSTAGVSPEVQLQASQLGLQREAMLSDEKFKLKKLYEEGQISKEELQQRWRDLDLKQQGLDIDKWYREQQAEIGKTEASAAMMRAQKEMTPEERIKLERSTPWRGSGGMLYNIVTGEVKVIPELVNEFGFGGMNANQLQRHVNTVLSRTRAQAVNIMKAKGIFNEDYFKQIAVASIDEKIKMAEEYVKTYTSLLKDEFDSAYGLGMLSPDQQQMLLPSYATIESLFGSDVAEILQGKNVSRRLETIVGGRQVATEDSTAISDNKATNLDSIAKKALEKKGK